MSAGAFAGVEAKPAKVPVVAGKFSIDFRSHLLKFLEAPVVYDFGIVFPWCQCNDCVLLCVVDSDAFVVVVLVVVG